MKREYYKCRKHKCFAFKAKIQKIKFGDKEVDKKNSIHLKKLFC